MSDNVKNTSNSEVKKYKETAILSSEFKRKKLIFWSIRTIIAVILFIVYWGYPWWKWALIVYVPLNLFSLYAIFKFESSVNKKMNEVVEKIIDLETEVVATEEE